jgi:8-hydroxy-5-deazaflavin:NADPH oxidoreductase
MRISVLGTGIAGRTLAAALAAVGHDVAVGTREVGGTAARADVAEWVAAHPDVPLVVLAEAGARAEVLLNATSGGGTLEALRGAAGGAAGLAGLVVADVSNPLDFSAGFPPTLSVANTDSMGEQVQAAFPEARVVKTLNTVNAQVMVRPGALRGDHLVFVAGEDAAAKAVVTGLLGDLGWPSSAIVDLGGIRAARATEMYLPLWLALMGEVGSPLFNIGIVRG